MDTPEPRSEMPLWARRAVHQARADVRAHIRGSFIGVLLLTIAPGVAGAFFRLPADPTLSDRLTNAVVPSLCGLLAALVLIFGIALFAAPYRQRNALRRLIASRDESAHSLSRLLSRGQALAEERIVDQQELAAWKAELEAFHSDLDKVAALGLDDVERALLKFSPGAMDRGYLHALDEEHNQQLIRLNDLLTRLAGVLERRQQ